MKKRLAVLLIISMFTWLFSSCENPMILSQQSSDETPSNTIHQYYTINDSASDVATLLYLGGEENVENSKSQLQKTYFKNLDDTWPSNIEEIQTENWSEAYLILPKYKNESITVVELIINGEFIIEKELITTNNPILLRCNFSDIVPSTRVTIHHNNQEIVFTPYMSLKDGSVMAADFVHTEDITR